MARQLGLPDVIAFDMGGTTAKAGVINDGKPLTTGSALIGGYEKALPIQIPMIDIFEVGTGGGSIARVGKGKSLRVGPHSAGSMPGPACYGRGGLEPTVTDANLLLGRLDADHFLGGQMKLDVLAAEKAMDAVAAELNLDRVRTADGILRIAATAMSYAVKAVTTERGLDAGKFTMIVYGGAGPLHASAIAREIGLRKVLIPYAPGYFSAYGMLFGDLRYDYVRSCFRKLAGVPFADLEAIFAEMEAEGRAQIASSRVMPEEILITRAADMRYVGQEHAVSVDLDNALFAAEDRAGVKAEFDRVHEVRYGTCAPTEPADLVSLRVTVTGVMRKPPMAPMRAAEHGADAAVRGVKPVYFRDAGDFVPTMVFIRDLLRPGHKIEGPALIEEHASTTVIQPGDVVEVDSYGNLLIAIGE